MTYKPTYAAGTKVAVSNSHAEILKLLVKHGASYYAVGAQGDVAVLGFKIKGASVRLRFPLPSYSDKDKPWSIWPWSDGQKRPFNPAKDEKYITKPTTTKLEQAMRERWRLVVLVIKTKLELVSLGARTVEQEFLDGLVLPSGKTVGQMLVDACEMKPEFLALPPGE
jgi:hypothetical protein